MSGPPHTTIPSRAWVVFALVAWLAGTIVAHGEDAPRPWREYPGFERDAPAELPADYQKPAEFVVGRLMYPDGGSRHCPFGRGGDWRRGGTPWAVDYPHGDRTFAHLLRRLSAVDARSVEQPVNLDDGDDVFNWPFLLVGLPGCWELTDAQVAKLREYLLRGGFLLCDSFYGSYEWAGFERGMRRIFPELAIVDIADDHPIFHVVYDLIDRPQIPTWQHLPLGFRDDGAEPRWRGVLDADGRILVMVTFNNDLGDGWQRADEPAYPQDRADLAIRLGMNFVVYTLTH